MDGVTLIRVFREIRRKRSDYINELPDTSRLIASQQPELPPPPPKIFNRCLNALLLLIIYTAGIGSIVLGSIHLHNCPAEKFLPAGLMIFGGMLILCRVLNCVYDCRSLCEEETCERVPPCFAMLNVILAFFLLGMFIQLCWWAFSVNPTTKPEDHLLPNYCDYTLYKTSFYGCIVGIIFYVLPIFCVCCVGCWSP